MILRRFMEQFVGYLIADATHTAATHTAVILNLVQDLWTSTQDTGLNNGCEILKQVQNDAFGLGEAP